MGEETRIDQKTGEVYTRDQWDHDCNHCVYTGGDPQPSWDSLPVISLPPGKEDEMREKLRHIYRPPRDIHRGDLLTKDLTSRNTYIVEDIAPGHFVVRHISNHTNEVWINEEPYIKLAQVNSK